MVNGRWFMVRGVAARNGIASCTTPVTEVVPERRRGTLERVRGGADVYDSTQSSDQSLPLFLDEKWPKIKERKQLSASALVESPTMSSADQLDSAVQVSPGMKALFTVAGPTIVPDQVAC